MISEIYTRLYRDLGNILQTGMKGTMAWRTYDTHAWDEIRNDPLSLMIPSLLGLNKPTISTSSEGSVAYYSVTWFNQLARTPSENLA